MFSADEWQRVPLDERLAYLSAHSDDPLLKATLDEVLLKFSNHAVFALRARVTDLESENRRLERLVYAPTPY